MVSRSQGGTVAWTSVVNSTSKCFSMNLRVASEWEHQKDFHIEPRREQQVTTNAATNILSKQRLSDGSFFSLKEISGNFSLELPKACEEHCAISLESFLGWPTQQTC